MMACKLILSAKMQINVKLEVSGVLNADRYPVAVQMTLLSFSGRDC